MEYIWQRDKIQQIIMQWKDVKDYFNNLHPAKQLFVINYKLRNNTNDEDNSLTKIPLKDLEDV